MYCYDYDCVRIDIICIYYNLTYLERCSRRGWGPLQLRSSRPPAKIREKRRRKRRKQKRNQTTGLYIVQGNCKCDEHVFNTSRRRKRFAKKSTRKKNTVRRKRTENCTKHDDGREKVRREGARETNTVVVDDGLRLWFCPRKKWQPACVLSASDVLGAWLDATNWLRDWVRETTTTCRALRSVLWRRSRRCAIPSAEPASGRPQVYYRSHSTATAAHNSAHPSNV